MRAAWAAGIVIGIVACHRAAEVQPTPARAVGEYSYRIKETPVYGKITIRPDTVTLEAQQHSCRRIDPGWILRQIHSFRCVTGSAVFNIDVNSWTPSTSTWRTATPVKKTVEICTEYGITAGGQKACTRTRTEVKTDTVHAGGSLDEVTRIAGADRP